MQTTKQSDRQLMKIAGGALFGRLGSDCLTFIIGLRILQLTDSTILFGFLQMIGPLVSFLLLPLAGSLVDTVNKKTLILMSQSLSIMALIFFLLSYSSVGFSTLFPTFLVIIVLKCSEQLSHLGLTASVHSLVVEEYVQRYKSIQQFIRALALLSVPALSVWLVNRWSILLLICIEILFEGLSVFFYSLIEFDLYSEDEKESTVPSQPFMTLFKEGILYVKHQPKLIFTLIFSILLSFLLGALTIGLPYLQINYLELPASIYGLTETIFALGLLLSSVLLSFKAIQFPLKTSATAIFFIGFSFFIFGVALIPNHPMWIYATLISLFNFTTGGLLSLLNIPFSTWMVQQIPTELQGRVFHLSNTGNELGTPIGIFFFSLLFDFVSPYSLFLTVGMVLMILIVLYPLLLQIDLKQHSLEIYENEG